MYEDCFDLCTLQSQLIEEPSKSQAENFSWWKKLTVRQSGSLSTPSHCVVISHFSMPVKRTKELRALTGWLVFSLLHNSLLACMAHGSKNWVNVEGHVTWHITQILGTKIFCASDLCSCLIRLIWVNIESWFCNLTIHNGKYCIGLCHGIKSRWLKWIFSGHPVTVWSLHIITFWKYPEQQQDLLSFSLSNILTFTYGTYLEMTRSWWMDWWWE